MSILIVFLLAACATPDRNGTQEADTPAPPVTAPPGADGTDTENEPAVREPVDPDVLFHVLAAERMGAAIQSPDALDHYLEAARLSSDPGVAEQATRMALGIPDWEAAIIGARRWRELDPDAVTPWQVLASAHLQLGAGDAAVSSLNGLLDRVIDTEAAWRQVAALLGVAPDAGMARVIMQTLIDERDGMEGPEAVWGQSLLAWRLDDLEQAIRLAEIAAERSGQRRHLVWAAQLQVADDDLEQALVWYTQARDTAPDDVELSLATAEVLHRLERTDEALALLADLPPGTESLYTRGMYLAETGRLAEARAVWDELVRIEPEQADVHAFYTAQLAELVERPEQALEWYARVSEGELLERATLRQAVLLGESGAMERARELLAGMRESGDRGTAEESWFQEARILQDAGREREALEVLSAALSEQPGSVVLLYARALLAVAMDDIGLAEQDLRRIIQENPDNAQAMNALGYTLADHTRRYREARRLITRALELTPEDPAVLDSMGWVLFKQGEPARAEPYLRDALARDDNPEIRAHLVEVLHVQDRTAEARALLEEGFEQTPDSAFLTEVRDRLGL